MKEIIYFQVNYNEIDIVVKINEKSITQRRLLLKEDTQKFHKKIGYPTFYSMKITEKDKMISREIIENKLKNKDVAKYLPKNGELHQIAIEHFTDKPQSKVNQNYQYKIYALL